MLCKVFGVWGFGVSGLRWFTGVLVSSVLGFLGSGFGIVSSEVAV